MKKEIKEIQKKCNHYFEFVKWQEFIQPGGTNSENWAIVICRKCGEIRIKKPK